MVCFDSVFCGTGDAQVLKAHRLWIAMVKVTKDKTWILVEMKGRFYVTM